MIEEASTRFGIPTSWIERVMRAESRGLTMLNGRPIRSRAGAMGLMQLMPATWADMRARLGLGRNPDDPRDNILSASFFLRLMYDRFSRSEEHTSVLQSLMCISYAVFCLKIKNSHKPQP